MMSCLRPLLATLVLALAGFAPPAMAENWFTQAISVEQSAWDQPIEKRPNRFGHLYGNMVRRLHHGRFFVNQGPNALSRYFYVP